MKALPFPTVISAGDRALWASCWQDGPTVPRQPFSFFWELSSSNWALNLGNVYGELLFNNSVIYTTKQIPFVLKSGNGTTGLQYEANVTLTDPKLISQFYKFGLQDVVFRVIASGRDKLPSPFETHVGFEITPEPVDLTWWDLTYSADNVNWYTSGVDVEWGSDWALRADFTNLSKYVAMSCDFKAHAVADGHSSFTNPAHFDPVSGGMRAQVTWSPIGDPQWWTWWATWWSWILPGTFTPTGPFDKTLACSVQFVLTDELGNQYPQLEFAYDRVHIVVPSWKIDLAVAAAATLAVGVALSLWPWPIDLVGAALELVAVGLYLGALDPPEAKSNYLEPVEMRMRAVPAVLVEDRRLAPLARFLKLMDAIVAAENALGEIQSRLLGARRDQNRDGVALQSRTYREVLRSLTKSVRQLHRATGQVLKMGPDVVMPTNEIQKILKKWQRQGIPASVQRAMTAAGLSKRDKSHMTKALNDTLVLRAAKFGLAKNFANLLTALNRHANAMKTRAPAILKAGSHPLTSATQVIAGNLHPASKQRRN